MKEVKERRQNMLERILDSEIEEILEWLEEYGDGTVRIVSFNWKNHCLTWHGDFRHSVIPPGDRFLKEPLIYDSWDAALEEVKKRVLIIYDLEEK